MRHEIRDLSKNSHNYGHYKSLNTLIYYLQLNLPASTSSAVCSLDMAVPMRKQDERERDRIPGITELRTKDSYMEGLGIRAYLKLNTEYKRHYNHFEHWRQCRN